MKDRESFSFTVFYCPQEHASYTNRFLYHYGMMLVIGDFVRLKELREKRKLSQQNLTTDLNMNQNSISCYETGTYEADYATLIKIADYFGVSIDYLLERTDNHNIPQ